MNPIARLKGWLRQRRRQHAAKRLRAPLREFVYMDEVSVFSLIGSRLGPVASEFTETQTTSLTNEVQASGSSSAGVLKGEAKVRAESNEAQSSQVLRKATIQTTFKELYELESKNLAARPFSPEQEPPRVRSFEEIRSGYGEPAFDGWLLGPMDWRRGQLIELEVELGADPSYRMGSILAAIVDIINDSPELFPQSMQDQLRNPMAVNRVLDRLLVGLIPIKATSVDYKVAIWNDESILIHRRLLDQIPASQSGDVHDLYVVGVTEQRLYWKDVRQILYSDLKFRMLCRVMGSELTSTWKPFKGVDLLGNVAPGLSEALIAFGSGVDGFVSEGALTFDTEDPKAKLMQDALKLYAKNLAEICSFDPPQEIQDLISGAAIQWGDSYANLAGRRHAFNEIRAIIEKRSDVTVTPEQAAYNRAIAMTESGLTLDGNAQTTPLRTPPEVKSNENYLDSEIIAIYW